MHAVASTLFTVILDAIFKTAVGDLDVSIMCCRGKLNNLKFAGDVRNYLPA